MEKTDIVTATVKKIIPFAPPLPLTSRSKGLKESSGSGKISERRYNSVVCSATQKLWDRLFDEAYKADVSISTDDGDVIRAHSIVLGTASPVMKNMLRGQSRIRHKKPLSIRGVPSDAVRVFVRFLYSSCLEEEEMEEHALHFLVLSHVYVIPHLKHMSERHIERRILCTENVVDIFQLALLCDCPRLGLVCHRMIVKSFKAVVETDGWKVMRESHPKLENELTISIIYEDALGKERVRKMAEKAIYLELYDAMEALVHIFRDGCQTIGPHDKAWVGRHIPCKFSTCRGLELLVRHFSACKTRTGMGRCVYCKGMWQLLQLHSRICADSRMCRVPLCRKLKYDGVTKQSKKEEMKWRILVKNILRAKGVPWGGGTTCDAKLFFGEL